jgi:molybdenum cofactor cytidylyltransferase
MVSDAPIVGVLLAAGSGSRFGGDKLQATLDDGRMMASVALSNLAKAVDLVVAVVRPEDDVLFASLGREGAHVCRCDRAADGMGASLACGVRASLVLYPAARGWIVALADMPWISAETISRVMEELKRGAALAAPIHGGKRGHPVGFAARFGGELAALAADEGARTLLRNNEQQMVLFDTDDAGVLRDVDTPQDLDGR